MLANSLPFAFPAKAGIQELQGALFPLGPRFRGEENRGMLLSGYTLATGRRETLYAVAGSPRTFTWNRDSMLRPGTSRLAVRNDLSSDVR